MLVLRRYGLATERGIDHREVCQKLREYYQAEPRHETLYALAELASLGSTRAEAMNSKKATQMQATAMLYAYQYLFDERFASQQNSYDPHFRGACEIYNGALESILRSVHKQQHLQPGDATEVEAVDHTLQLAVSCRGQGWRNQDFEDFKFVSDYEVTGLQNHYRSYGLGVPLIAVRKVDASRAGPDRYYPPGLTFPVTAFLRIEPGDADKQFRCTLELHDPLVVDAVPVAGRPVPLETDLTTPLAYFLSQPELQKLDISTVGVLKPEKIKPLQGIYMVEPYRPNRIPVVMVHGLWSSPITWMQMFNDLRGSPELRNRYQFWFYLYPTGQPFWYSAAQLRNDLRHAREELDPYRQQHLLDQMVLVGHSMGGLVSHLQTIDSGDDFWRTVSSQPAQLLNASATERQTLEQAFFFEPNQSVKRVITIATPHRGSYFSNGTTQYLGNKLIELPMKWVDARAKLKRENPGYFLPSNPLDVTTSIESLSTESKFLQVMLQAQNAEQVTYHNIVGLSERGGLTGRLARSINDGDSDGVVAVASAKFDKAVSEVVVPADHSKVHAHPLAVLEVRRVLLEHLRQLPEGPQSPLERIPWTADQAPAVTPTINPPRVNHVRWAEGEPAKN
jgi:pimeloyl-ACP methyl ester carboxylesterase